MRGIRSLTLLAAAVSLAIVLGGSPISTAHADEGNDGSRKPVMDKEFGGHGRHGEHEKGGMHRGWEMFKGLDLSAAQREQIKGIMKGHHREFTEGKIAALRARQNLMAATTGAAFDQAAIQKAYGELSAAQEKMVVLRAKVFSEVNPILTADQQTVVSGRLAKARLHMQQMISKLEARQSRQEK